MKHNIYQIIFCLRKYEEKAFVAGPVGLACAVGQIGLGEAVGGRWQWALAAAANEPAKQVQLELALPTSHFEFEHAVTTFKIEVKGMACSCNLQGH